MPDLLIDSPVFVGTEIYVGGDCSIQDNATFGGDASLTVGGDFSAVGTEATPIELLGSGWLLDVSGTGTAHWVSVENSNASAGSTIYALFSTNLGGNDNWIFANEAATSLVGVAELDTFTQAILHGGTGLQANAIFSARRWQHLGEAIRYRLITTLGELVGTRVYPNHFPKSAVFPAIAYTIISNTHRRNLSGANGMAVARVQFDILSHSINEKIAIARALETSLSGFRGEIESIRIGNIKFVSAIDGDEIDGGASLLCRKSCDYQIYYYESRPFQPTAGTLTADTIEECLVSYLSDIAPIYPTLLPKSSPRPAIVYHQSGEVNLPDVITGELSRIESPTFSFSVLADTYGDVAVLSQTIRERLDGLSGTLIGRQAFNVVLVNESDTYKQTFGNSATYWNTLTFNIHIERI